MSVRIDSLTVRFGEVTAVDDVDLEINAGERFAVMGPSGSGKSTLLRAIAGLEPCEGDVEIDGTPMHGVPTHERPIGMMFQDYALFPHLDVRANIAFGLRMSGLDRPSSDTRVDDLLDLVGLGGFGDRNVATLSGGEQQRVALARTLAPRPSLVLFDEPLGAIDQGLKDALLSEMREIMDQLGITSIYVTHDRLEAEAFAARIGIIHDGRLVRVDTPEHLWTDPGTEFVARFVGHRNIVDAAHLALKRGDLEPGDLEPGKVVVPMRAIRLSEDATAPRTGTVVAAAFRDGEFDVTVESGDQILVATGTSPFAVGTTVGIDIDEDAVARLAVDEV